MVVNVFMFALGAVFGSFLNACIFRLPRGKSIFFPPSHCPHCGKRIRSYDLIPILSYIHLKGRCRSCKTRISLRYPIVELLCALLFIMAPYFLARPAYDPLVIFYLFFSLLLILAAFSDLETQIIPDEPIYLGVPAAVIFHYLYGNLLSSVTGLFLGFALMFFIAQLGRLIFKKEALGFGDMLFALFMGALLGWEKLLIALFLGYLIGAVFSSIFILLKWKKMSDYIPFGPFLALGTFISLFFGQNIVNWYLANFIY